MNSLGIWFDMSLLSTHNVIRSTTGVEHRKLSCTLLTRIVDY